VPYLPCPATHLYTAQTPRFFFPSHAVCYTTAWPCLSRRYGSEEVVVALGRSPAIKPGGRGGVARYASGEDGSTLYVYGIAREWFSSSLAT
jgi:hypothetical protein